MSARSTLAPQDRDAAYREGTLAKIGDSWLFRNQVRFAELALTPLTRDNARWTFNTATALLHYSPEPVVIEKAIESAVMLNLDDEALAHLARYRAAFRRSMRAGPRQRPARFQALTACPRPAQGLVKLPDLPPCFSSSFTSVMVMARSAALHMS